MKIETAYYIQLNAAYLGNIFTRDLVLGAYINTDTNKMQV